jgi:hypothetical protein
LLTSSRLYYANASLNIATDLLVAVLPMKAIWALQLPKMQKVALLAILTLGWFVCIVSILRLHALVVLAQHPEDQTWYSTATAYWSAIEVNLAIVCASTPALKPLVVKVIPAFSTRYGSRVYGSNSGTEQNKSRKFVELSNKNFPPTATDDLELGDTPLITALPVPSYGPGRQAIHVRHNIEQRSEGNGRHIES